MLAVDTNVLVYAAERTRNFMAPAATAPSRIIHWQTAKRTQ